MALLRYGVVGIASNLAGYLVYLILTAGGVPPKLAMSMLYGVGVAIGYLGNRGWSFEDRRPYATTLVPYLLCHGVGYGVNFMMLFAFVDRLGYPHRWVQAISIFVVAAILFILFRVFVFPRQSTGDVA